MAVLDTTGDGTVSLEEVRGSLIVRMLPPSPALLSRPEPSSQPLPLL